jgi:hypothetical protein
VERITKTTIKQSIGTLIKGSDFMSKYRLYHTLIVLMVMVSVAYGLMERSTKGIIVTVVTAVIGAVLVILNHKKNNPKSQTR